MNPAPAPPAAAAAAPAAPAQMMVQPQMMVQNQPQMMVQPQPQMMMYQPQPQKYKNKHKKTYVSLSCRERIYAVLDRYLNFNLRLFQSNFLILPRFPLKNPLSFLPPALQYIGEYAPMGPNSVCGLIRHEILQLETKL